MKWEELTAHLNCKGENHQAHFEVEDIVFTVERIESDEAVLLSADFDNLPKDATGEMIMRAMLEANHLFAGTYGASLSVDPDTMRASIQQMLWIDHLNLDEFMIRVKTFVDVATEWKQKTSNAHEFMKETLIPSPWSASEGLILV